MICSNCEKKILKEIFQIKNWRAKCSKVKNGSRIFCSKKCRDYVLGQESSVRMKIKNPMLKSESVEKMKKTLKLIGHKPINIGGNGRGFTELQKKLLQALGENWHPEFFILTGNGYLPYHYKIDIANPIKKIAIEIYVPYHQSKNSKIRDKMKEELLLSKGYKTLRFTNKDVMENAETIASTIMSTILK